MSGLQIARAARAASGNGSDGAAAAEPVGPDAAHLRAQDRFVKEGKKLSDPEKFKRELHPFDGYERLKVQAANNEPPKADDNFRWRFYGLFYCAPNQAAYMCRLRIPNGILKHWQFAGVGDLAERYAGGYSHVTARANLPMAAAEPQERVRRRGGGTGWGRVFGGTGAQKHPHRPGAADRRYRPAGADRHATLCARMALSHPQRSLALRHSAQVQRRLRRRRCHSG